MMAAAEARAAWQRTANRCFVQEDAKRAPKLACPTPSSAYPSSKQADSSPTDIPEGLENPNVGFTPRNRNPSYSNLPPESRWWLQVQPNYVYNKGLPNEQVNSVGAEMEKCEAKVRNTSLKRENDVPFIDVEMKESYEFLEMDSIGSSTSKKVDELGFDTDSLWTGSGRSEPWWRVVDGDELASLVSQRSLEFIENCDLPRPQNRSVKKDPYAFSGKCDTVGILQSSDEPKGRESGFSNSKIDTCSLATLGNSHKEAFCEEQGLFGSDKQSSLNSDETFHKGLNNPLGNDPTKAQLMEALRHSQTRAREAENAAKQAKAEKEHIVKLFFKQASHLFAYKQWLQLLQLENIYYHIKNSDHPLSSLFPSGLLFTPNENAKFPKNPRKPTKGKKRSKKAPHEQDFSKFTVAFAVGLGLVGAGLFLGWTFAWMLPAF